MTFRDGWRKANQFAVGDAKAYVARMEHEKRGKQASNTGNWSLAGLLSQDLGYRLVGHVGLGAPAVHRQAHRLLNSQADSRHG